MQKITLEISNTIYDYIMFFLENIPKNLLKIKGEAQPKVDNSKQNKSSIKKKLPSGFLNPIQIDSYENIAARDEIYENRVFLDTNIFIYALTKPKNIDDTSKRDSFS